MNIFKEEIKRQMRHPVNRMVVLGSAFVILLLIFISIWRSISSYTQAYETGHTDAERLGKVVADHVELTFLAVDITLRRAAERQYFNSLFGNKLKGDMENNLAVWVDQTPQISAMILTDEAGKIQSIYRKQGYKTWMEGRDTIAKSDYFKIHKESSDRQLLFAEPQPNWINNGKFVVMSRRISKLDGSFGGVVLAAVSSKYVTNFFASLNVSKHTRILLFHENRKLLIGQLDDARDLKYISEVLDEIEPQITQPGEQTVRDLKDAKGNLRILSYSIAPNLKMGIAVVLHGRDVFSIWWQERIHDLLLLLLFLILTVILTGVAIATLKQIRRAERSERAALMATQAKSDFLANMSHELRTPLNAIIGFSEMLDSGYFGNLNTKQKERVHDINMCGSHLLELINDILEFSKGAAGKLELKEERVNMTALTSECVRFFLERASRSDVELVEQVPHDLPRVIADQRKMKQILLNLISNAVKFSHRGGKVEISAKINEEGGITISVSDRGLGMAPEDIPKALSVFGQVHAQDGVEGTGLGLPLSKVFAELHDGQLKMESLKGVGTRVSIWLPKSRVVKTDGFKVP